MLTRHIAGKIHRDNVLIGFRVPQPAFVKHLDYLAFPVFVSILAIGLIIRGCL